MRPPRWVYYLQHWVICKLLVASNSLPPLPSSGAIFARKGVLNVLICPAVLAILCAVQLPAPLFTEPSCKGGGCKRELDDDKNKVAGEALALHGQRGG